MAHGAAPSQSRACPARCGRPACLRLVVLALTAATAGLLLVSLVAPPSHLLVVRAADPATLAHQQPAPPAAVSSPVMRDTISAPSPLQGRPPRASLSPAVLPPSPAPPVPTSTATPHLPSPTPTPIPQRPTPSPPLPPQISTRRMPHESASRSAALCARGAAEDASGACVTKVGAWGAWPAPHFCAGGSVQVRPWRRTPCRVLLGVTCSRACGLLMRRYFPLFTKCRYCGSRGAHPCGIPARLYRGRELCRACGSSCDGGSFAGSFL